MDLLPRIGIIAPIFLLSISSVVFSAGNDTDKLSLLEFKAVIERDPLGLLGSWNESTEFCSWPGVTCSHHHRHRVAALDVSRWQLEGRLSPHIGNFSFLRRLNLANNRFRNSIPPEIGRLFRMRVLNFQNNSFAGEIPANLSSCSSLRILRLFSNNLAGVIPREIGLLSELRIVDLSKNSLAGEIPSSVGNLSSVVKLSLSGNSLHGTIPASLGRLRSLKIIVLGMNNLTGTIPLSLYNVSTIEYFSVNHNKLNGILPPNLGLTLPNLKYLLLNKNNFSGPIPETISNASNLVVFQISRNNFFGKVPSFASSSNMQRLGIFYNQLGYAENGDLDFLRGLVNCTDLEVLSIDDNNLGGSIPEDFSNMTSKSLREIQFGRNYISGEIPAEIGNLAGLEILGLEQNYLTGPIPSTIGKLKNMNYLTVEENGLSGTIPFDIKNLTFLSTLSLAVNNIQGNIPISLGECRKLQVLSLSQNNLSGPIPSQVISLSSLSINLDLSANQLSGSIPKEVGNLVNLGNLDISENMLSGEIPRTLGSCKSMEYLSLQGNFLQGSIPKDLDSLVGVQAIDLSRNNLSGQIPMYFARFRGLMYLNLSFNDFEGQVPQQGVFENTSAFSATGNTRLCGGIAELKLNMCASNGNKKNKLFPKKKLIIIFSCVITGLMLVLCLVILGFGSRKRSKSVSEDQIGGSLQRVSYGDLSKATNGFSQENLIGAGSFGSVYKGILDEDERLIAVKVLNLGVSRALKSFAAECETLRIIKHRNLVKLLTVCSSIDFQRNDFKALVYEFMENGNLEEWIHSDRTGQAQRRRLSLIQRISIAIDVASALDYLHNDGPEAVVHCDIKPSNVLLDGQMVAHVGDFGLAKLLRNVFPISSSNQISSGGVRGTVGYAAPEYAMGSEVSTLGDIYSYGILLLEMFTMKRPTDNMFKDEFNLHNFASTVLPERIYEVVDPTILLDIDGEEGEGSEVRHETRRLDDKDQIIRASLISIVEIGVACSSSFPRERLNIGDVVVELSRIRDILISSRRRSRYRVRNM